MHPSTLPNRVRGIGPGAACSVLLLAFDLFGRATNLQLGISNRPAEDLLQAADDMFGHADDSVHVIWCFALLSVVKALAADAGTLHRPG